METLARKLVDAVHDSQLERLFGRLMPAYFMILLSSDQIGRDGPPGWASERDFGIGLVLVCIFPIYAFLTWAIGALANRKPHPGEPTVYNGFDAWRSPTRAVHPTAPLRGLVSALGRGRSGVTVWTLAALGAAAMLLALWPGLLDQLWPDHPPPLDFWVIGIVAIVAAHIRVWAVDARTRLAAQAEA